LLPTVPRLRLSLLELLDNEDPLRRGRGRALTWNENLKDLKESVRKNLQAVLNTRRLEDAVPPEFEHCEDSLLTYGLPDFAGFTVADNDDRERLGAAIGRAIRRFEPRLTGLKVVADNGDPKKREGVIHYRIDAWLRIEPVPEPVTFDTVLEASKWHFLVAYDR